MKIKEINPGVGDAGAILRKKLLQAENNIFLKLH